MTIVDIESQYGILRICLTFVPSIGMYEELKGVAIEKELFENFNTHQLVLSFIMQHFPR